MQKTALMLDVGVGNGVDGGSLKMYFQPLYRHRKNNQKFMASLQGAPENTLTVLTCNTLCKKITIILTIITTRCWVPKYPSRCNFNLCTTIVTISNTITTTRWRVPKGTPYLIFVFFFYTGKIFGE